MGSILKGLTLKCIPTDQDDLRVVIKWRLNPKSQAQAFIERGEVGAVEGVLELQRTDLQGFSREGREAFLVYWAEGIREIEMIAMNGCPDVKEIEELMISESSRIIELKMASFEHFKEKMVALERENIDDRVYQFMREIHLIRQDKYEDEELESVMQSVMVTLRKRASADRSHWIQEYGNDYLKFMDAKGKIELVVVDYVLQRLKLELPGFQLATPNMRFERLLNNYERYSEDILAVEGKLTYLDFELGLVSFDGSKELEPAIIGDGYLGEFLIYKLLEPRQIESRQSSSPVLGSRVSIGISPAGYTGG